jgi:hypothetical protein
LLRWHYPASRATLRPLPSHQTGLPRLPEPSFRRAAPTTPADRAGAHVDFPAHAAFPKWQEGRHPRCHLRATAAFLGIDASATFVRDISELESVVAAHAGVPLGGLVIIPDAYMTDHSREVISLAARYRLPTVYSNLLLFAESGGLLSYGSEVLDNFRRAAIYADRILRGAKPGELPVQAPEKFELVINLKTAKALGLTVSPTLLARADEVIE